VRHATAPRPTCARATTPRSRSRTRISSVGESEQSASTPPSPHACLVAVEQPRLARAAPSTRIVRGTPLLESVGVELAHPSVTATRRRDSRGRDDLLGLDHLSQSGRRAPTRLHRKSCLHGRPRGRAARCWREKPVRRFVAALAAPGRDQLGGDSRSAPSTSHPAIASRSALESELHATVVDVRPSRGRPEYSGTYRDHLVSSGSQRGMDSLGRGLVSHQFYIGGVHPRPSECPSRCNVGGVRIRHAHSCSYAPACLTLVSSRLEVTWLKRNNRVRLAAVSSTIKRRHTLCRSGGRGQPLLRGTIVSNSPRPGSDRLGPETATSRASVRDRGQDTSLTGTPCWRCTSE